MDFFVVVCFYAYAFLYFFKMFVMHFVGDNISFASGKAPEV